MQQEYKFVRHYSLAGTFMFMTVSGVQRLAKIYYNWIYLSHAAILVAAILNWICCIFIGSLLCKFHLYGWEVCECVCMWVAVLHAFLCLLGIVLVARDFILLHGRSNYFKIIKLINFCSPCWPGAKILKVLLVFFFVPWAPFFFAVFTGAPMWLVGSN